MSVCILSFWTLTFSSLCVIPVFLTGRCAAYLAVWRVNLKEELLLWLYTESLSLCVVSVCICIHVYLMFLLSVRTALYHCLRLLLERLMWLPIHRRLTEGPAVWQVIDVWMIWEDAICSLSLTLCVRVCLQAKEQVSLKEKFKLIAFFSYRELRSWLLMHVKISY